MQTALLLHALLLCHVHAQPCAADDATHLVIPVRRRPQGRPPAVDPLALSDARALHTACMLSLPSCVPALLGQAHPGQGKPPASPCLPTLAYRWLIGSLATAPLAQANMTPFAKQCLSEMAPKYLIELFQEAELLVRAGGDGGVRANGRHCCTRVGPRSWHTDWFCEFAAQSWDRAGWAAIASGELLGRRCVHRCATASRPLHPSPAASCPRR